jgi:hypothetical protein
VYSQAIADLNLGGFRLRRTASLCPLLGNTNRFHPIVEGMIAPGGWLAAPPSLPTPFIVGNGRLRIGGTSKPSSFHTLDVLGDALGLFGLPGGVGHGRVLGQLAGVHDEKTALFHSAAPVRVFHLHLADDTLSMPASHRLRTGTARFFKQ